MENNEGLEKSRKKIEALERHARWFIEEYNAGRILHFKNEEDLEAQGFMRIASHLVLRDEVFRMADAISDEDMTFLQSFSAKLEKTDTQEHGEAITQDQAVSDEQDAPDDSDADLMEDAISEIVSMNGSEHNASPETPRAASMFAHLTKKAD